MNKRTTYIAGAVCLVLFAGFALTSFRSALTQYVSFDEARAAGRNVQVMGALAKDSTSYDATAESLRFTLSDPESGKTIRVRYAGLKPANFEDAVSIVAIGRYDRAGDEFTADKLLVKCPSKYQGAEVEERTYG